MRIKNLSMRDYQSNPAISRSDLVKISNSISAFLAPKEDAKNPAFIVGSWTHTRIQEPHLYTPVIVPKMGRDTQKFEKLILAEIEKNPALSYDSFLTQNEADEIELCYSSIMSHPKASQIYNDPVKEIETSFFWTDPETGIECKCRTDCIWKGYIPDLKTTSGAVDEETIKGIIKRYKYHAQAAWYLHGVRLDMPEIQGFIFVFVSKTTGEVALYELDDDALTKGWDFCRSALDKLDKWNQTKNQNLKFVNQAEIRVLNIPYL